MKLMQSKFKKTIRCKVIATNGEVKIRFPKQIVGNISLLFENGTKSIILRQWEIILKDNALWTEKIK